jgi:hypothetical protein
MQELLYSKKMQELLFKSSAAHGVVLNVNTTSSRVACASQKMHVAIIIIKGKIKAPFLIGHKKEQMKNHLSCSRVITR